MPGSFMLNLYRSHSWMLRRFKAAVPQLYTIGDGELVLAARIATDRLSRPTAGSRSNIAFFRGISKCCDILDTPFGKHDNTTTLGTLLASLITQSKEIAHVLGSPADDCSREVRQTLHIA
jgi:hypothetical protein